MMYLVFELGCSKWVKIDVTKVTYTSDRNAATQFDKRLLMSAAGFFEDFALYPHTMYAVPVGGNNSPNEYPTVRTVLHKWMMEKQTELAEYENEDKS